jgi:putative transposase
MIAVVNDVGARLGIEPTCAAIGLSRATYYRHRHGPKVGVARRRLPKHALDDSQRKAVLDVLHEDRFIDLPPTEIYAQLLDEGRYECSIRTMYRILAANAEVCERRRQRVHPPYAKPELLVLDIFSRYVVGWLVADRESSVLAKHLILESCTRHEIQPGQLTIHQDRGTSMTSKTLAQTYASLGVTKSFSRPHVSDDNPFSESQFKTLKYRPDFPKRFTDLRHAERHCVDFFDWYNYEHHHVALGLMTPHDVHSGLALAKWRSRADALETAYAAHPDRFPRGVPAPPPLPIAAYINRPITTTNLDQLEAAQ